MSGVEESESTQRFRRVLKVARQIHESHDLVHKLRAAEDGPDTPEERCDKIARLTDSTRRSLAHEKQIILDALKHIEHILCVRRDAVAAGRTPPTLDDLHKRVQAFFSETHPLLAAPYAPLCGAMPLPEDQVIPNGSFVCATNPNVPDGVDGHFFLAFVFGFDPEHACYFVCDADPELDRVVEIQVQADAVVPMPTSIPARRAKKTNHPAKSEVLSLWYDESGGWTTVFYPATVNGVPTSSPGLYQLTFDGDPPYVAQIPEQFVVRRPRPTPVRKVNV